MMLSNSTDLVRKDSIEELCGHRARALQLYSQALECLEAAQKAHKLACGGKEYTSSDFLRDLRYTHKDSFTANARRGVDQDMWRYFIVGTPLGSLMDTEEKRKFEDSLKHEAPEVTPDTVFATMARLAGDADAIFRRGLVNAFRGFCGDYRSHDGFKIGKRFIINHLITPGNDRHRYVSHYRDSQVQDMDRCMHVLDGKPAPEYQEGILAAIRTAIAARESTATGDYFKVNWFTNGNAHFYPLRADLVERANKLIAQHFGETLGAGPDARAA